jgi:hypothetical protein
MLEEEGIEPTERVQADVVVAVEETTTAEVPDWLQDEVPESWSEESLEAEEPVIAELVKEQADTKPGPKPKAPATAVTDTQKQQKFLTGILYALVAVAVIIFIMMIFMAWNSFF